METQDSYLISKWVSIMNRQFQCYFNHHMKDYDITSAEYFYLIHLHYENNLSQDDLATKVFIDKAAVARGIASLEQKGYVVRQKDPQDKRINRVNITPSGDQAFYAIKKVTSAWNKLVTSELSKEDAIQLSTHLEAIVNRLLQMPLGD